MVWPKPSPCAAGFHGDFLVLSLSLSFAVLGTEPKAFPLSYTLTLFYFETGCG